MRAHVVEPQQIEQPEVPLTRRERRAAARGGSAKNGRIPVKAGAKLPSPPVRHRDYATRKRG
jgi:hypothetical protein